MENKWKIKMEKNNDFNCDFTNNINPIQKINKKNSRITIKITNKNHIKKNKKIMILIVINHCLQSNTKKNITKKMENHQ